MELAWNDGKGADPAFGGDEEEERGERGEHRGAPLTQIDRRYDQRQNQQVGKVAGGDTSQQDCEHQHADSAQPEEEGLNPLLHGDAISEGRNDRNGPGRDQGDSERVGCEPGKGGSAKWDVESDRGRRPPDHRSRRWAEHASFEESADIGYAHNPVRLREPATQDLARYVSFDRVGNCRSEDERPFVPTHRYC